MAIIFKVPNISLLRGIPIQLYIPTLQYEVINNKLCAELLKSLKERRVFSIEAILEPEKRLKYPISHNNSIFFDRF